MTFSDQLSRVIRTIPDFPKPGIQFKDITPILQDPALLRATADALAEPYRNRGIEKVVGIESRGF
ncbi:MAG TPA: adenine phosphoribosyltransferase, partial [Bacteroidetes bacterium]|nr:adenine phosphoribosyltransferase [Bacteroidota bacterium]